MITTLTLRNLRIFFRDRMGVFFALLSPLIMLVLYIFFLGNVQVEDLQDKFAHAGSGTIQAFVSSWAFAGILMITTLTTALAALNVFVEDRASGRFKDFMVSPVSRRQLIAGYMASTFIISLLLTTLVLVVGQVYFRLTGNPFTGWQNLAAGYGYIALSSACFSALCSFFVTFVKTTAAFTSLSVIVGTAAGFLAGIYIQPGTLSAGVVKVINCLPFAQSSTIIRKPFTEVAAQQLTAGQPEAAVRLSQHYGIDALQIGGYQLKPAGIIVIFTGIIVAFTLLGAWRLRTKIN